MDTLTALQERLSRVQFIALVVGIIGVVLCVIGFVTQPVQFYRSYLFGYLFWLGLGLGCMSIAMVHHLTGGRWGFSIRRFLEAGISTLPLMALLFLPIVLGTEASRTAEAPPLYEWANDEHVSHDPVLQRKVEYLNVPFFYARAAFYFVAWIFVGFVLNRWSLKRDRSGDLRYSKRLQLFSGPGVLLYAITMTFAAVDWGMSLEPHWFSTIYGVLFLIGQAVNALAFVTIVAVLVHAYKPFSEKLSINRFHDLGNMLLASVMLWAYVSFSQFLIIWSGNLPEETPWYVHRTEGGWRFLALSLIVFHFFVPFLLLLARITKRNPRTLLAIAAGLMVMRLVDLYWIIKPAFAHHGIAVHWLDLVTPVAVGGLWLAMYCWQLKSKATVSVIADPIDSPVHHHEPSAQKVAG